jgi:hypothetical protein
LVCVIEVSESQNQISYLLSMGLSLGDEVEMSGDDDERAIETQRLVQELAEVRKRMQQRAEQPPLRNGSGAYRAVTPLPFLAAAAIAKTSEGKQRTSPPPAEPAATTEPKPAPIDDEPPPPTKRRASP